MRKRKSVEEAGERKGVEDGERIDVRNGVGIGRLGRTEERKRS